MEILRDTEEMVTCPYNKSHRILKKRIQPHLSKCRNQHKNSNIVICDFNTTHHVPRAELQHHHENCESRRGFERMCYREEPVKTYTFLVKCDNEGNSIDGNPKNHSKKKRHLKKSETNANEEPSRNDDEIVAIEDENKENSKESETDSMENTVDEISDLYMKLKLGANKSYNASSNIGK